MRERQSGHGRGLMLSVSAAAILAVTAGSASAQGDCAAEIAALQQQVGQIEAAQQSPEGRRQQAAAEAADAPGQEQQAGAPGASSGSAPAMGQPDQPPREGQEGAQILVIEPEAAGAGQQQPRADQAGATDQQQPSSDQAGAGGPQQQAMGQSQQLAQPGDTQQGTAGAVDNTTGAQRDVAGEERLSEAQPEREIAPHQMQAVRPPAGAMTGRPGDMAAGSPPAGAQQQAQVQPDQMRSVGPLQRGNTARPSGAENSITTDDGDTPVSNPLVLLMADGTVVDMRPPEDPTAQAAQGGQQQPSAGQQQAAAQAQPQAPQAAQAAGGETQQAGAEASNIDDIVKPGPIESWEASEGELFAVEASLTEAEAALQQGNEQACMEAIQEARAIIEEHDLDESAEEGPIETANPPRSIQPQATEPADGAAPRPQ